MAAAVQEPQVTVSSLHDPIEQDASAKKKRKIYQAVLTCRKQWKGEGRLTIDEYVAVRGIGRGRKRATGMGPIPDSALR